MMPFITCGFFHRLLIFLFISHSERASRARRQKWKTHNGATEQLAARLRPHTRCKDLLLVHFIVMNLLPTRGRWQQSSQTYQMSLASARSAPETGTLAITLRLGATGAALWCREPSAATDWSKSPGKAFFLGGRGSSRREPSRRDSRDISKSIQFCYQTKTD